MKQLMEDLKKRLVSNQQHELLPHNFEGVSGHLFTDQASNAKHGNKHSSWYSLKTKQFAVTLHYNSPKAYDFVCKVLALPHPSSIPGQHQSTVSLVSYVMSSSYLVVW